MTALRLVLMREVPSQNVRERTHWRAQRQEVLRWSASAGLLTDTQRVGVWSSRALSLSPLPGSGHFLYRHDTWTGHGKRTVRITSYRARRITDHANLVGGCKGLIDGLVRAGLLVDDSDQWIAAEYRQALRSAPDNPHPGKSCTVVEIDQP